MKRADVISEDAPVPNLIDNARLRRTELIMRGYAQYATPRLTNT